MIKKIELQIELHIQLIVKLKPPNKIALVLLVAIVNA